MAKKSSTSNPIIAALDSFMAVYDDPMNFSGKDRPPHGGILNNLSYLTSCLHRNLYEPVRTQTGTYPGIKERMDNSQRRLNDLMRQYDGDTAGAMSDPEFLRWEQTAREDEAYYDFICTLFTWFSETYGVAASQEWKPAAAPATKKPTLTIEQEAAAVARVNALQARMKNRAAA